MNIYLLHTRYLYDIGQAAIQCYYIISVFAHEKFVFVRFARIDLRKCFCQAQAAV